ncbi:hypothetical protein, partial [Rahnella perminowiae]
VVCGTLFSRAVASSLQLYFYPSLVLLIFVFDRRSAPVNGVIILPRLTAGFFLHKKTHNWRKLWAQQVREN